MRICICYRPYRPRIDLDRACYLDHYDFLEPPHTLSLSQLQNWWADDENFDKVTRVEYGNIMPFPLNYTMPHRMRKSVLDKLEAAKLLKRKQVPDACEQVGSLAFELHPSHHTRADAMRCDVMIDSRPSTRLVNATKCLRHASERTSTSSTTSRRRSMPSCSHTWHCSSTPRCRTLTSRRSSKSLALWCGTASRFCNRRSASYRRFSSQPRPLQYVCILLVFARSLALGSLLCHRGSPNASATGV